MSAIHAGRNPTDETLFILLGDGSEVRAEAGSCDQTIGATAGIVISSRTVKVIQVSPTEFHRRQLDLLDCFQTRLSSVVLTGSFDYDKTQQASFEHTWLDKLAIKSHTRVNVYTIFYSCAFVSVSLCISEIYDSKIATSVLRLHSLLDVT